MENQRVLTPLSELDKHPDKSHEVEHSWIVSIFTAIQKNFLVMLRRFTEQNTKINESLNLGSSNTEVLKKLTRTQDEQKKLLSELKESVEKAKEPKKEKIFISHKQLLSGPITLLTLGDIPSGEYTLFKKIRVIEKNEFALIDDECSFEIVNIENGEYQLSICMPSTIEGEVPTANVVVDILFIP